jgi:DNA-binding response OmpR family regulator
MKVLVIEDSPDVRLLLEMELRLHGFDVVSAGSAAQSLESARRERPHVVVADLGLPDMDGRPLLALLREAGGLADAVAIAVSGFGSWSEVETAQAAGYDAVLVKPVEIELLLKTIAEALRPRAAAERTHEAQP